DDTTPAGSGSVTLPAVTAAGAGSVDIAGVGAATVAAVAITGAGRVEAAGAGEVELPPVVVRGRGAEQVTPWWEPDPVGYTDATVGYERSEERRVGERLYMVLTY